VSSTVLVGNLPKSTKITGNLNQQDQFLTQKSTLAFSISL